MDLFNCERFAMMSVQLCTVLVVLQVVLVVVLVEVLQVVFGVVLLRLTL